MVRVMRGYQNIATFAVLSAVLAGCGYHVQVYKVPPEAARRALVGTQIPDIAFGDAAHAEPAIATDDGVAWHIDEGPGESSAPGEGSSHEIMVLTATLSGAGAGTLVTVDIAPASGANKSVFEKTMSDHPAVADLFRTIAGEAVDAGLSHRAFAFDHIHAQMAIATLSLLPEIRQQMDEAGRAADERDRETIDDAYRNADR